MHALERGRLHLIPASSVPLPRIVLRIPSSACVNLSSKTRPTIYRDAYRVISCNAKDIISVCYCDGLCDVRFAVVQSVLVAGHALRGSIDCCGREEVP